jgi:uncharacterized SAM-dependent methyltransferase
LRTLFKDCPFIRITGLLGTYDDCVTWLTGLKIPRAHDGSVTILWLGNSIANVDNQEQASAFLERFGTACEQSRLGCRFVVSTDICQKDDKVLEAYDVERPEYQEFLLNAAEAANTSLGFDAFSLGDWQPDSWLDNYERNLHFYLRARRDLVVPLGPKNTDSEAVRIRKGERVRLVTSGKWSEDAMTDLCGRAGFCIRQRWKDAAGDYCECH